MIECKNDGFVLKNAWYKYAMGIDSDGKLYHVGFLPAEMSGRLDPAAARRRLPHPFPFEVLVNIDYEPLQIPHGARYFWPLCSYRAVYSGYETEKIPGGERLCVILKDPKGGPVIRLYYEVYDDSPALRRHTAVENPSERETVVNHVSAFVLANFPYCGGAEDPNDLYLHSFKSHWSWEGKHEVSSFDRLGLFKKWCRNGHVVENFSSLSSQTYVPQFVVEERDAGLFWGVQIECSGPWRFEIGSAEIDCENWFYVQGGPGNDRARCSVTLKPGERFETPPCSLTAAAGSLDEVCNRLHRHREKVLIRRSRLDENLPVVYNDWQYMFGDVTDAKITEQLDTLKDCGVECYVIDAGWFTSTDRSDPASGWWDAAGDWEFNPERFPRGLTRVAREIADRGMIPGIWCEIEAVGKCSKTYRRENLLQKRGPFFVEDVNRRFLHFGKPETRAFADEVFERLIGYGFRYFKIDYNIDNAPGCGHAEDSLGRGLFEHRRGYFRWLEELRRRHPDIIVEHCSSGGMRLDYAMLARTDLASITDQENNRYTGNILFQVSRLVHPSQCGNWSTLKPEFDREEFAATLINSMMGRMCVSGNLMKCSPEQRQLLSRATAFYKRYRHILKSPTVRYRTPDVPYEENDRILAFEYRNPENTESVLCAMRLNAAEDAFEVRPDGLARGVYEITSFPDGRVFRETAENLAEKGLRIEFPRPYTSRLLLFERI